MLSAVQYVTVSVVNDHTHAVQTGVHKPFGSDLQV